MSLTKLSRVAVDWDGTLIADDTWPEMGDWLPYAPEAIHALAAIFEEVVIWSCRTASVDLDEKTGRDPWPQITAILERLDEIEAPSNVTIWIEPHKPPAQFYIDNRALRFEGDWKHTLRRVLALKIPTNQEDPAVEHFFDPANVPGYNSSFEGMEVISLEDFLAGRLDKAVPLEHFQVAQQSPVSDADWYDAVRAAEDTGVRQFETGATRNNDSDQLDYEGFLSPLALRAYAEYMHEHRFQADGTIRDSDNWQKGIPLESYMKSLIRHVFDLWLMWRDAPHLSREKNPQKILAAILFNAQGALHETVKAGIVE